MLKHLAISLALASTAITAQAQQSQVSGGYVGASIGRMTANTDPVTWPAGVAGTTSGDESATGWRVFGGYQLHPNWAIEGGYADWGEADGNVTFTAPIALAGTQVITNVKFNGVFADLVGTVPLSDQFQLNGRIGTAYTTIKGSIATTNAGLNAALVASGFDFNPEHSEWNGRLGFGAQFSVSKTVAIRLDWDRTFAVGDKNKTGEGDLNFLSLGIQARF